MEGKTYEPKTGNLMKAEMGKTYVISVPHIVGVVDNVFEITVNTDEDIQRVKAYMSDKRCTVTEKQGC
jgi:hypothetical protein